MPDATQGGAPLVPGQGSEAEKAGFLANKKVQAVGRSPAALPADAVAGTTDKLFFVKKKGPDFTSNPAILLGNLG
jgi:hypothetical protein